LGCAPDVFLGAGVQEFRKIIDDGLIGDIVGAKVTLMYHGPDEVHPHPDFLYKKGAGPMLDVGPYSLSELLYCMGPAKELCCYGGIKTNPRYMKHHWVDVEVNTYYNAIVLFQNGASASVNFSWETWGPIGGPCVQIYGKKGSVFLQDPDHYGAGAKVTLIESKDLEDENGEITWEKTQHIDEYRKEAPVLFESPHENRGLGLSEMADAILNGRKNLANGDFACHFTELLDGCNISIATGQPYTMKTTFAQQGRIPVDFQTKMAQYK
jgi:predicted dehydrogenase